MKIDSHKISLETLSEAIFQLPEGHKGIIYRIAKKGPGILTEITKETERYGKWETDRWSAKNRIYGSAKFFGLIPCEYLVQKVHDRPQRGKQGKIFCLTTKGMLAALSTGLNLDEIYLYKKYVDFIYQRLNFKVKKIGENKVPTEEDLLDKKRLHNIIENFIKTRIKLFLIWHYVNGVQLQRQIATQNYFTDFYRNVNEYFNAKFPTVNEKKLAEYSRNILRENFVYSKILHVLDDLADPTNSEMFPNVPAPMKQWLFDKIAMTSWYIWYWPYYIEKMQLIGTNFKEEYDVKPIPDFIYQPNKGIDIDSVSTTKKILEKPTLNLRVKSDLKKLRIKGNYMKDIIDKVWNEPHEVFRILEMTRLHHT